MKFFSTACIFTAILICVSCAQFNSFYETEINGEKFVLQEKESKGFSTNSFEWRFKYGDLPYLEISPAKTDWGPPYSTSIYGDSKFGYVTERDTLYKNEIKTNETTHCFLYLNPHQISEKQFEEYLDFMKKNWEKETRQFEDNDLRGFPQIIGIVYGNLDNFTRTFKGKLKEWGTGDLVKVKLEVLPDGRISLVDQKTLSDNYSGLSQQVIMPGKILKFKDDTYSLDDIKTLKDKDGKDITDYFKIIEE